MFLAHSFHSLRYGTASVGDLVEGASKLGIRELALTDINTVTGIYEFYKLCLTHQVKPVVGVDIRVDNELYYIALAKNPKGISEINRLLTEFNCENIPVPRQNPEFENVFVIYPLENAPEALSEDEFIGIRPEEKTLSPPTADASSWCIVF